MVSMTNGDMSEGLSLTLADKDLTYVWRHKTSALDYMWWVLYYYDTNKSTPV